MSLYSIHQHYHFTYQTLNLALYIIQGISKEIADITSDLRLRNNDIFFLTETYSNSIGDVNEIRSLLNKFAINFSMNNYVF